MHVFSLFSFTLRGMQCRQPKAGIVKTVLARERNIYNTIYNLTLTLSCAAEVCVQTFSRAVRYFFISGRIMFAKSA